RARPGRELRGAPVGSHRRQRSPLGGNDDLRSIATCIASRKGDRAKRLRTGQRPSRAARSLPGPCVPLTPSRGRTSLAHTFERPLHLCTQSRALSRARRWSPWSRPSRPAENCYRLLFNVDRFLFPAGSSGEEKQQLGAADAYHMTLSVPLEPLHHP